MTQFTEVELLEFQQDKWIDKCYELQCELEKEQHRFREYRWKMIEMFNLLYIEAPRSVVNGVEVVEWDKVRLMMEKILETS